MVRFNLVLPLLGLAISSLYISGHVDEARLRELDTYVGNYVSDKRIPGLAVAVIDGTNVVFSKGYGADGRRKIPFKIGSLSKSVTAVAVMQLVEAGRINLDSPVGRTFRGFARGTARTRIR